MCEVHLSCEVEVCKRVFNFFFYVSVCFCQELTVGMILWLNTNNLIIILVDNSGVGMFSQKGGFWLSRK